MKHISLIPTNYRTFQWLPQSITPVSFVDKLLFTNIDSANRTNESAARKKIRCRFFFVTEADFFDMTEFMKC